MCGVRFLHEDPGWEQSGPARPGRLHAATGAHGPRPHHSLCQRGEAPMSEIHDT